MRSLCSREIKFQSTYSESHSLGVHDSVSFMHSQTGNCRGCRRQLLPSSSEQPSWLLLLLLLTLSPSLHFFPPMWYKWNPIVHCFSSAGVFNVAWALSSSVLLAVPALCSSCFLYFPPLLSCTRLFILLSVKGHSSSECSVSFLNLISCCGCCVWVGPGECVLGQGVISENSWGDL